VGSKFEVYSYVPVVSATARGSYDYKLVYAGESLEDALRILCNEKASGVFCCKLEWR
jgi:hypothetical protein